MVEPPPNYFYDLPADLQHAIYVFAFLQDHRAAFAGTLAALSGGAVGDRLRDLAERPMETSSNVPFGSAHAVPAASIEDAFRAASLSTCAGSSLDYLARASMYQRSTDIRRLIMAIWDDRRRIREGRRAGVDADVRTRGAEPRVDGSAPTTHNSPGRL